MHPRSDTVPPTSFSICVNMVLVTCVLRAYVLCAIVMRCAGRKTHIHISHTANRVSLGNCMGLTELFFFEDVCLPERVSRNLLGTAGPEG